MLYYIYNFHSVLMKSVLVDLKSVTGDLEEQLFCMFDFVGCLHSSILFISIISYNKPNAL